MLLNPTRSHRMQTDREEKRKREINQPRPAAEIYDRNIVEHREGEIDDEPSVPHRDRFQTRRPGQLKKRKEREPKRLAIPLVAHQPRFPMVGQVRVLLVVALVRMMFSMINAAAHRSR